MSTHTQQLLSYIYIQYTCYIYVYLLVLNVWVGWLVAAEERERETLSFVWFCVLFCLRVVVVFCFDLFLSEPRPSPFLPSSRRCCSHTAHHINASSLALALVVLLFAFAFVPK